MQCLWKKHFECWAEEFELNPVSERHPFESTAEAQQNEIAFQ